MSRIVTYNPDKRTTRDVENEHNIARGHSAILWLKGPAFYAPRRGVLTHRVRYVLTHLHRDSSGEWVETHHSVSYLCGNQNCFHDGETGLYTDPPADRFLCHACEAKVERLKLPSGDKLAGRHIHRAVLVPQQTCCGGKRHA